MIVDSLMVIFLGAGVIVLAVFVYYAVRLLSTFRKGMLERGWKLVVVGAILLGVAQIPILTAALISGSLSRPLTDAGELVRFAGIIFLILGFRAQYQIWKIDRKTPPQTYGEGATIER